MYNSFHLIRHVFLSTINFTHSDVYQLDVALFPRGRSAYGAQEYSSTTAHFSVIACKVFIFRYSYATKTNICQNEPINQARKNEPPLTVFSCGQLPQVEERSSKADAEKAEPSSPSRSLTNKNKKSQGKSLGLFNWDYPGSFCYSYRIC